MVTVIFSLTGKQFPFPVLVKVRVNEPDVMSAALGMYVAFNVKLSGVNVPVPLDVHIPPLAKLTDPDKLTLELFAQTV